MNEKSSLIGRHEKLWRVNNALLYVTCSSSSSTFGGGGGDGGSCFNHEKNIAKSGHLHKLAVFQSLMAAELGTE